MTNVSAPLSVVVPTCNRGDQIMATIHSILNTAYPHLEIIIVDQSDDGATRSAVEQWQNDDRIIYLHTPVKGAGNARNLGVHSAAHEFVALTDDDCTVAANWPQTIVNALSADECCAVLYTNVMSVPHNEAEGFVPAYERTENKRFKSTYSLIDSQGLGAKHGCTAHPIPQTWGL